MRVLRVLVCSVVLVFGAAAPAVARPQSPPAGIPFPAQSRPWGVSYEQWAKQWVRYAFEAPAPTNPLLNQTCTSTLFGLITFVPAAIDTGLDADCSVNWGTTLLLSPGGSICSDGPGPGPSPTCASEEFSLVDDASLTIDGRPVVALERFVVSTSQFTLNLPADNLFEVPPGPSPSFFTGYMVAFLVLAPGEHTIVMSDHFEGDPTSLDVAIHLHVGGFPF
jgi:hypothetical protein